MLTVSFQLFISVHIQFTFSSQFAKITKLSSHFGAQSTPALEGIEVLVLEWTCDAKRHKDIKKTCCYGAHDDGGPLNWAEGLPKIQQRATARSSALTGGAGKFMKSYEIHSWCHHMSPRSRLIRDYVCVGCSRTDKDRNTLKHGHATTSKEVKWMSLCSPLHLCQMERIDIYAVPDRISPSLSCMAVSCSAVSELPPMDT